MAALPNGVIIQVARGIHRYFDDIVKIARWAGLIPEYISYDKQELLDSLVAVDAYIDSELSNFNSAFPAPSRNKFSAGQKVFIFSCLLLARYDVTSLKNLLNVE